MAKNIETSGYSQRDNAEHEGYGMPKKVILLNAIGFVIFFFGDL